MFITPSFKKSLIVEQFQGNYLNGEKGYSVCHDKSDNKIELPHRESPICLWRVSTLSNLNLPLISFVCVVSFLPTLFLAFSLFSRLFSRHLGKAADPKLITALDSLNIAD